MQSRLESLYESVHNTWIGFIISMTVQQFLIAPAALHLQGCYLSPTFNVIATCIFTVISVARNYFIRRYHVLKMKHGLRNVYEVLVYIFTRKKVSL